MQQPKKSTSGIKQMLVIMLVLGIVALFAGILISL
jgi:vacuolar-type H+-ATPase subunit I/STV1